MEKDNSSKLQKTSRSILKVDFGEQGVRYVSKSVLQLGGSFEENQDYVLDTTDKEGIQSERNDKKKKVQEKLRPAKHANILDNREMGPARGKEKPKDCYFHLVSASTYLFGRGGPPPREHGGYRGIHDWE